MEQITLSRKPPSRAAVHRIGQEIKNVISELNDVADTLTCAETLRERVRALDDAIDSLRDIRESLVKRIVDLRILRGDCARPAAMTDDGND